MVSAASYCLWDPDSCSWQTMCVHRAAATTIMTNSSEFMLDSVLGCYLSTRDTASRHFNLHPERKQQNTDLPTSVPAACWRSCCPCGKQCFSCCGRYIWFARCLDLIFLKSHHAENILMLSFSQFLSLLISWYSFSLLCWSASKIVRPHISLSSFVRHHIVSPWAASDSVNIQIRFQ